MGGARKERLRLRRRRRDNRVGIAGGDRRSEVACVPLEGLRPAGQQLAEPRLDAVLEEGPEGGDSDGDADLAERVVDRRAGRGLRFRHHADRRLGDRRVDEPDPGTDEQEAGEQRRPVGVHVQASPEQQPGAGQAEAGPDQRPERHAFRELRRQRREDERHGGDGEQPEPGLERRVAEHVLQVEDDIEQHREHRGRDREGRQRGSGERGHAEEPDVEHRARRPQLDGDERREQHGAGAEAADDLGARPALAVAAEQAEHEQEEAARRMSRARPSRAGRGSDRAPRAVA